jgi:hypothetical protein
VPPAVDQGCGGGAPAQMTTTMQTSPRWPWGWAPQVGRSDHFNRSSGDSWAVFLLGTWRRARRRGRRRRWAIYYESVYRGSRGVYRGPCEYERRTWHAHFSYAACPIAVRRMPGWAYGGCPFSGPVSTDFSTASRDLPTGVVFPRGLGDTPHAQFPGTGSVLDLGPRVRSSVRNGHAAYGFAR